MGRRTRRKSALSRLRYDRLVMAVAVLVAIGCLIYSCGKSGDKKPASVASSSSAVDSIIAQQALADNSMAVFLSPSNQTDNHYAGSDSATEASVMRAVANAAEQYLKAKGVTVYMAKETDTLEDKVNTANTLGVGTYVAIHSNAGGTSGTASGTEIYYNPQTKGSRVLAKNVYAAVAALTPTDDRDMHPGTGGEDRELYEVINPTMANCLVEIEFHDQANLAQWIIANTDAIGKAVCDGILHYQEVLRNTTPGTTPVGSDTGTGTGTGVGTGAGTTTTTTTGIQAVAALPREHEDAAA